MAGEEAEAYGLGSLQRELKYELPSNFVDFGEMLRYADKSSQTLSNWHKMVRNADKNSLTLSKWRSMQISKITELHRVSHTPLEEYRLSSDARHVVRGILQYFFKLFDRKIVPASPIDQDKIHVMRDMVIWVADGETYESSDTSRREAIDNMIDIIRWLVGENLPKDVEHLLRCLDQFKTEDYMKEVALMHPCLHPNWRITGFIRQVYHLYVRHRYNKTTDYSKITAITNAIPPYCHSGVDWKSRIRNDAGGSKAWNLLLDTSEVEHDPVFNAPIGILIFMSAMLQRRESRGRHDPARCIGNVEDELFVLFPAYMSYFVEFMVSGEHFKES